MNLYSHCKVTPYFVPFQTFSHLFLQLVATTGLQGDKSKSFILNVSQISSILRYIYFHKPCENYFLMKKLIISEKSCIFAPTKIKVYE